jgi:COP9 signalosome complex subunit 5
MTDLLKDSDLVIDDSVFRFDDGAWQKFLQSNCWESHPQYFKKVKINALALMKMVRHSIKGSPIEVMGKIQGTIVGDALIVLDVIPLPVEGTETRVNAGAEAQEYEAKYGELGSDAGKQFGAIGWYHSHPGYGPFLSGIDVGTQRDMQMMGPTVALVVDPISTSITGKVDIGAFRTFRDGNQKVESLVDFGEGIPEDKIKDFGAWHAHYYRLPIEYFVSSTDLPIVKDMCSRFWIRSLKDDEMSNNQEYFVSKLHDFRVKAEATGTILRTEKKVGAKGGLKNLFKFSKEVSQSVHQECLRALSFKS